MRRQRVVKLTLAAGMVGLLILPALVYTQVTGRVLNPRLRQTYTRPVGGCRSRSS
jgi:hypothetical protein